MLFVCLPILGYTLLVGAIRQKCTVWKGSLLVQLPTLLCSTHYAERCFSSVEFMFALDMLCASMFCRLLLCAGE